MKCNSGKAERILRATVGLVLIALTITGIVGAWGWVGVVPLLTGIIGFCPAFSVLGMSTCSINK